MVSRDIFEDLFVLEMTNNHLGRLDRGIEIVRQHSHVVRANNIRAAIKVQFRDVDSFIHDDFKHRTDIRYVRRVTETVMSKREYATLIQAIRDAGCIPMATPFDEKSVDWCVDFDLPIIKVASADASDWRLLEQIALTRKPVIVSIGGASEQEIDNVVNFFDEYQIALALNHCVAAYPHEPEECQLNQIDYLISRYPDHTIGYSSHEYCDWVYSAAIAYAKGARTFERHIDIDSDGGEIADYSSLPNEVDAWFKAFLTTKKYCGTKSSSRVQPLKRETDYLDNYVRGAYANRDLTAGHVLTDDDIQLAIPISRGQVSCRELVAGAVMRYGCVKGQPINIEMIAPENRRNSLRKEVIQRLDSDKTGVQDSLVKLWRFSRAAESEPIECRSEFTENVKQCG